MNECNYSVIGVSLNNSEKRNLRRVADLLGLSPAEVIKGSLKYVLSLDAHTRERYIMWAREENENETV